jgi:D-amino-acid dehydrogenase
VAYGYVLPAAPDDAETTRELEPALSHDVAASAFVGGDRHLDPGELVAGLEKWLAEHEVAVHRDQRVIGLAGGGTTVRTPNGDLAADVVVIAAGAWSAALCRQLGYRLPLQAGKGYSFSVDLPVRPRTPLYLLEAKVAVTEMGRRVRLAGLMELSGVDPRMDPRRVQAMARHASPYLAGWPVGGVDEQWAGLRPMTPDGLPVIGRVPGRDNVFVATGHAMLGVTLGPVTGEAIADLIAGGSDEPFHAFRPERFL